MLPVGFLRKSGFRGLLRSHRRDLGRRIVDHEASAERGHDTRKLIEAGPTRCGFDGRDASLADAITGSNVTIGTLTADIFAPRSENWAMGELVRAQTTPVVSCDIPVTVRIKRS